MSAHRILGLQQVPKGWAVRPLKRYASWVQNVVRQFGPYPAWAQDIAGGLPLVREDRAGLAAGVPVALPSAWPGSQAGTG